MQQMISLMTTTICDPRLPASPRMEKEEPILRGKMSQLVNRILYITKTQRMKDRSKQKQVSGASIN